VDGYFTTENNSKIGRRLSIYKYSTREGKQGLRDTRERNAHAGTATGGNMTGGRHPARRSAFSISSPRRGPPGGKTIVGPRVLRREWDRRFNPPPGWAPGGEQRVGVADPEQHAFQSAPGWGHRGKRANRPRRRRCSLVKKRCFQFPPPAGPPGETFAGQGSPATPLNERFQSPPLGPGGKTLATSPGPGRPARVPLVSIRPRLRPTGGKNAGFWLQRLERLQVQSPPGWGHPGETGALS